MNILTGKLMKIYKVSLLNGTKQIIGDGNSQPFRALVRNKLDGEIFSVICKKIPQQKIAAECFAALILREWGISTPEPCIVDDEGEFFYGSRDATYPNLKQRMNWDDKLSDPVKEQLIRIAAKIIATWSETGTVIAADEAIANFDRHIGQILWDGGDPVWVDHDQSLGVADDFMPNANKLASLLVACDVHLEILPRAIAQSFTFSNACLNVAESELDSLEYGFADFVADRLPALATKVLARFPQPKDLLQVAMQ